MIKSKVEYPYTTCKALSYSIDILISFNLIVRFTQKKIPQDNLNKGTIFNPGKVVLNKIVKKLLLDKELKHLVIVLYWNMVESFAHAALLHLPEVLQYSQYSPPWQQDQAFSGLSWEILLSHRIWCSKELEGGYWG